MYLVVTHTIKKVTKHWRFHPLEHRRGVFIPAQNKDFPFKVCHVSSSQFATTHLYPTWELHYSACKDETRSHVNVDQCDFPSCGISSFTKMSVVLYLYVYLSIIVYILHACICQVRGLLKNVWELITRRSLHCKDEQPRANKLHLKNVKMYIKHHQSRSIFYQFFFMSRYTQ